MGEIKEEDAGQGADQEDDIKPTVVEVELQLSQNLRHNGAILQRHAHAHQQYGWYKIHPHDLSEDKHDDIWGLVTWYCIEELSEGDE